jgi:hypothetical protein
MYLKAALYIYIYDESKERKHVLEESFCEGKQKNPHTFLNPLTQ